MHWIVFLPLGACLHGSSLLERSFLFVYLVNSHKFQDVALIPSFKMIFLTLVPKADQFFFYDLN